MGVRENVVEKYLDKQIISLGGLTRKWVSPGRSGVPDRIVVFNGNVYFVEVKTVKGRLSVPQVREHKKLTDCGAKVFTVYGIPGVNEFIKGINYV